MPIGKRDVIAGATAEAMRAFYHRTYRPERATVVVVGDSISSLIFQAALCEALPECFALQKFHHQVGPALMFPGVVDLNHIGL